MVPSEQCRSLVLLEHGGGGRSESRSLDLDGRPERNIIWRQGGMVDRAVDLHFTGFT